MVCGDLNSKHIGSRMCVTGLYPLVIKAWTHRGQNVVIFCFVTVSKEPNSME